MPVYLMLRLSNCCNSEHNAGTVGEDRFGNKLFYVR